jgi:hypothetical protein
MVSSMVTADNSPQTAADSSAQHETAKADRHTRRRPARSVVRGAGVFLDTAWRVVLFGGEMKH